MDSVAAKHSGQLWTNHLSPVNTLRVLSASELPPPSIGNACILEGTIPEPMGKESQIVSISFLLQGRPTVEVFDGALATTHHIAPDSFSISPAGSDYRYRTQGAHRSLILMVQDASIQDFARIELNHRGPRVDLIYCLNAMSPEEIPMLGKAFAKLIQSPRKGTALYAQTLWTQIVLQLLWHCSSISCKSSNQQINTLEDARLNRVIDYMHATLSEDISLSDLSSFVNLSPGYFLRSFKKATGKTPGQYRLDLRLARACELLKSTSLPVSEIAVRTGFSSHSQLSTAFRRQIGISPSAYRRSTH